MHNEPFFLRLSWNSDLVAGFQDNALGEVWRLLAEGRLRDILGE
jgi:hypothetical protein